MLLLQYKSDIITKKVKDIISMTISVLGITIIFDSTASSTVGLHSSSSLALELVTGDKGPNSKPVSSQLSSALVLSAVKKYEVN